jgi:hypothetical protein
MTDIAIYPSDPADSLEEALAGELQKVCADKELHPYLLLDASRSPEIRFVLQTLSDDALCLFDGAAFEDLAEVAPWLVPLSVHNDDVLSWFMDEGYGNDWGLFLLAGHASRRVKTSLKRSIRVSDETGKEMYFKYYRPSVFNTYVPLMEADQASYLLRDIGQVWAEDVDAPNRIRRYAIREETLRRADLALNLISSGEA